MATVWNFIVMSDNFQVMEICTSKNYTEQQITKVYNY